MLVLSWITVQSLLKQLSNNHFQLFLQMLIQKGTTWVKCLVSCTTGYSILASYGALFNVIWQIRVFNLKMCCCSTGELGHCLLWFPTGKKSVKTVLRQAWRLYLKPIELGKVWHTPFFFRHTKAPFAIWANIFLNWRSVFSYNLKDSLVLVALALYLEVWFCGVFCYADKSINTYA